ncbi:MAG: MBL fold metallo-hydrolase [Agathobacter sp.]|nr:MBL fold metallo-hydrolase [Agathobacter sp.]
MEIYNAGNRIMNTYVYKSSVGYIMIDTGYEHSLKDVEKKLNKKNIKLSDIKYVFLTHAHDDHAGFLNELLGKTTELKVIMSDKAMPTLKRGQNSFDGGCSTFLAWLFCKLMGLVGKAEHEFPVIEDKYDDRFIEITEENKTELEALLEGKIILTPGHTSDSISLKIDDKIFCGDAAMNGFPSVKRWIIWIEDRVQFKKSWEVMLSEDVNWIYPAHGNPFRKEDLAKYKNQISNIQLRKLK